MKALKSSFAKLCLLIFGILVLGLTSCKKDGTSSGFDKSKLKITIDEVTQFDGDNDVFIDYTIKNESDQDYDFAEYGLNNNLIKLKIQVTTTDNSVFTEEHLIQEISANTTQASITSVTVSAGKKYKSLTYELVN